MTTNIRLGFTTDFMKSFAAIPQAEQSKVMGLLDKFRDNPTSSAINYEPISNFRDKKLRSLRAGQTYRVIVMKPEKGNTYVMLWVDHHDKAYRWARNKMIEIHPDTGAIQLFDVEHITPEVTEQQAPAGLFDDWRDRQLCRLGVPELLLARVRSVGDEAGMDDLIGVLPDDAWERLSELLSGVDYAGLVLEAESTTEVDTHDFDVALEHPDTKRRIRTFTDDEELRRMLEAPLEMWRVFLHPTQEALVHNTWNGPSRVLGGAGTGKTVVAMHRARFLVEQVFTDGNDRILFTTYTRNLAEDISANLDTIITDKKTRARIEVINLDRRVANFLRRNGYSKDIAYGSMWRKHWRQAMLPASPEWTVPDSFYREEWEQVVQAGEITDLKSYLRVSRVGRGRRMGRNERKLAWKVFEAYRLIIKQQGLEEPEDAMIDACGLLAYQGAVLPYRAVIVDEAQDMSPQAFTLIRQMVPETEDHEGQLFITGDAHQRIYRHKVVLSRCGINIRGRSRKLKVNYRTTAENRRFAVDLLKGRQFDNLDGSEDPLDVSLSLMRGSVPEVEHFTSSDKELEAIVAHIQALSEQGAARGICLVARTNDLVDEYGHKLKEAGLETNRIKRREAEDPTIPSIRLAAMHRVKGLEFDHMILAAVNDGVVPPSKMLADTEDKTIRRQQEQTELALLYVAATRARKTVLITVLITSYGKVSGYLEK